MEQEKSLKKNLENGVSPGNNTTNSESLKTDQLETRNRQREEAKK